MNRHVHSLIFGVGCGLALRLVAGVGLDSWRWWVAMLIIGGLHVFLPRGDGE